MKRRSMRKMWLKIETEDGYTLFRSESDPHRYKVRSRRSDKDRRKIFSADSLSSAIRRARILVGEEVETRSPVRLEIADAFNLVLARASRGKKSTDDWNYYVRKFMAWLSEVHPDLELWNQIDRHMVRAYLDVYQGKSATVRRLAIQPIAQTSGYMSREMCFVDFAGRLGIGNRLEVTPAAVYLPDVIEFLDFLRDENPRLEVGVGLQSLAGLQLQEATRLSWDRVDLDRALVEISGEVKNRYRNRLIPLSSRLSDAVQRSRRRRGRPTEEVQSITEHVVLSSRGLPYEDSWCNYSKEVSQAIRKWNPKVKWKPKDLRNCLPTFSAINGLHNDIWEQYIGHAPRTVTQRHYLPRLTSSSRGEAAEQARQMDILRAQVIDPLDRAITQIEGAMGNVGTIWHSAHVLPTDEMPRVCS